MSEPKLISPMLDNFYIGEPISDHHGVRCCPAMEKNTEDKYIVKIISVPSSKNQLDALLLTGAYPDEASALEYFKDLADDVTVEAEVLKKLSSLEGFLPYEKYQLVPMEDEVGYDVYLLSSYKRSLDRQFGRTPMTHLGVLNLGLDLCASLAVCRRSGYLYVNLKPSNVFITSEQSYLIGDLGFVKLDSLKYASLPNKYRSPYTAPEIGDAFSSLNTTIDIYALGLILYQAYNNGALPFTSDSAPAEQFPAPLYADYEMSEIILKACAPNPDDRWQDPIQMGQALVSYMQRNGANDTPIVPPVVPAKSETEENVALVQAETEAPQVPELPTESADPEIIATATADDSMVATAEGDDEELLYSEDDFGNLSFLLDISNDDIASDDLDGEIAYDEITAEVSAMLSQADDLAAHPTPDPVVAPEMIDVPMPAPIPIEPVAAANDSAETTSGEEDTEEDQMAGILPSNADNNPEPTDTDDVLPPAPKKKRHWLRNCIIVLIILALIAAAVCFVRYYYLLPIDSVEVVGSENNLTVHVVTDVDESLLTVICSDSHGNQYTQPLVNGQASFKDLVPDTAYNIKVVVTGFHRLIGDATAAYSTPVQTNIVQFTAITGMEDGSAILGFTVHGPDSSQWTVVYSAEGEEERTETFFSHMAKLTGLTVGKEYTLRLEPEADLYLTGIEQIKFTASKLIYAQNLTINSCANNALTASWTAPADAAVESWTVRCYNDSDYDETVTTNATSYTFEGLDHADSYTVEVTAVGMSVSQMAFVPKGSITISDLQVDTSDPNRLALTWNSSNAVSEDGWSVSYTIANSDISGFISCPENSATLETVIPGATYIFTIQSVDGAPLLSNVYTITLPEATAFSGTFDGYTTTSDSIIFSMCRTPADPDWNRYDVHESDYKTTYTVGERASFLMKLTEPYGSTKDPIVIMYVITDADGKILSAESTRQSWTSMWYKYYGELDIPSLPATPGDYSVGVYFNGQLATQQDFTITV